MNTPKQPAAFGIDHSHPVFSAPWQAHAFALTAKLHEQEHFSWNEWSNALADAVANSSATDQPADSAAYYRDWLEALEKLLTDKNIVSLNELIARQKELERE